MFKRYLTAAFVCALAFFCAETASAQIDDPLFPGRDGRRAEESLKIKEMLARQKTERDKRDYEELLKRGAQALELSNQLQKSFENNKSLTSEDKKKLESLEKLATKIRNELGGSDDESEGLQDKPAAFSDAFRFMQSTTAKLVGELKKTSRYSISVVAIESSNTLIRLTRFLRLGK